MSLFVDQRVKKFFITLAAIAFLGITIAQIIVYLNARQCKNELIEHDYEIAGYLSQKHPELASDIQKAFAADADKLAEHQETGQSLLEQIGYKNSVNINLVPRVNEIYKTNRAVIFIFTFVFALAILLVVYFFLKNRCQKIEQYNNDVNKIINGEISARLDDNDEGSLARLATSVNVMAASLYTHFEKEKQDRVFLKDILTNVSHQLKTPLSALMIYTEIMKNEKTENEVIGKFLTKSENELDRMQVLIANLLKLARLDAGIIVLNKSNCNLNNLVEKMAESFAARLQKEQKTFAFKFGSKSGGIVSYLCDQEWLYEALSNIFKNAVEHTRAGNRIQVLLEKTPLLVKITFADNGEGISPEDINHIFKRFYRSRFSQNKQGTGIGLTLAQTIIEMHGGFISVESEVNKGTKVVVHLPILQNCKI